MHGYGKRKNNGTNALSGYPVLKVKFNWIYNRISWNSGRLREGCEFFLERLECKLLKTALRIFRVEKKLRQIFSA